MTSWQGISPVRAGVERWSSGPQAVARVGANAARRGLALLEALEELDRAIAAGLIPQGLDRFEVAREVANGWADTRRDVVDPASSSSGLASSAYLRARVHDGYRRDATALAVVVVRSPPDAVANVTIDQTSVAGSTVAEHGPGVHVVFGSRDAAVEISARLGAAHPNARVWIESLPRDRGHVDGWLGDLRSNEGPTPARAPRAGRARDVDWWESWQAHPSASSAGPVRIELASALVEHVDDRDGTRLAAYEYASRRRDEGATWFDVLAEVGALIEVIGRGAGRLDSVMTVYELGMAWSVAGIDDAITAGVMDPLTGLPGRHYLRRRVRELDRGREAARLRLLTIRLALGSGVSSLTDRVRAAQRLRWWLRSVDTLAVASTASFSAVVSTNEVSALARRCAAVAPGAVIRAFRLVADPSAVRT